MVYYIFAANTFQESTKILKSIIWNNNTCLDKKFALEIFYTHFPLNGGHIARLVGM